MLRAIITFALLGVGYALFAATFRPKKCSGNCGSCANACHPEGDHHA